MVQPSHLNEPSRDAFPIVAVGASAGGLAPTGELLRELGPEPGIAMVVIHHLDPTHESGLVEILTRATVMPVAAAVDGVCVEPNRVYVVPPNAGLLIRRGILKVVPRVEAGGLHLPIDRFCESLALDHDGMAVGVVLSGSGFDGTEGIKAIKREGGITLAQDATATFASMPESAIATGSVDFILPPSGLARELARIGGYAPSFRAVPPRGIEEPDYPRILALMRKASGVDFESYKQSTVRRRLQRRLALRGVSDLEAYLVLLQRDPTEIGTLCEEVLIHVTGFFREPETFDALSTHVFPKLCDSRPRDAPLRIWVPGCSTGEEVYSIAIRLLEYLRDARKELPIKIFGTDLGLTVIEKARAGRYPENIEREVSHGRLQRFFTKEEAGYRIRPEVRELCVFAKHDLTRDPPFSSMDLISCRNLMIYLGHELRDRVIALLHYALKEPGFLALGSSETAGAFAGFVAVDGKNKIYARTSAASRLAFDFATPSLGSAPTESMAAGVPASGARSAGASDVHREADRLVLAEFAPPGVVVTSDLAIVQFRGKTGLFLEHAPGAASLDLLRTTREELRLPLRRTIDRARSTQRAASETGIPLLIGEERRPVTLKVIPFALHATHQHFFLVLFEEGAPRDVEAEMASVAPSPEEAQAAESGVREELASTRRYLESVVEQLEATNEELRAANEEIVSSNEELRSTNEELQSAKEELQGTNEELRTVNDELGDRNVEATGLSNDLTNVLSSADIPMLIVGRDLRLRRFTPAAARVFGLVATDLRRPLGDVQHLMAVAPSLVRRMTEVLEHLHATDCTIQDSSGRYHQVSVRPYLTLDGRIDGTVIAARDIDAETRSAELLDAARKYAEDIVETVREGLVVLDRDFRVRSANTAFQRGFCVPIEQIVGRRLDELGRPELATPALRKLLEELGGGASAEGFQLEHSDGAGGLRVFLLNARHIEGTELFLIAIEDVTEAERARTLRVELGFRDALANAAEGILMIDPTGLVVFANVAAARLFGYACEELTRMKVDLLFPDPHRVGRRKDGTEFPIEVSRSAITREDGAVVVAFITDVTGRRKAEREIRAYQDRLQRMAFDAAVTEERERRRIAIELHDWIGQDLALAQIKLAPVRSELEGESRAAVDGAVELIEKAISDSRTLVFELSPPVLYDLGLEAALAWLAEDIEKRHRLKLEVTDDGADKPLGDAAKAIIFRAVRELVMNVLKHANVAAAKVSLRRSDADLDIDVEDGGTGFDPDAPTDRSSPGGFGLLSVREQITRLGGTLKIASTPGKGTRVSVRVPLQTGEVSAPRKAAP